MHRERSDWRSLTRLRDVHRSQSLYSWQNGRAFAGPICRRSPSFPKGPISEPTLSQRDGLQAAFQRENHSRATVPEVSRLASKAAFPSYDRRRREKVRTRASFDNTSGQAPEVAVRCFPPSRRFIPHRRYSLTWTSRWKPVPVSPVRGSPPFETTTRSAGYRPLRMDRRSISHPSEAGIEGRSCRSGNW